MVDAELGTSVASSKEMTLSEFIQFVPPSLYNGDRLSKILITWRGGKFSKKTGENIRPQ